MASRPPSLAEQVEPFGLWEAGEPPAVEASVIYHHRAHGTGLTLRE